MKRIIILVQKITAYLLCIGMVISLIPCGHLTVQADSSVEYVKIDSEHFPQMYKTLRRNCYDKNQDGWLSKNEIASLKDLYIDTKISSLEGIEYLTEIERLFFHDYNGTKLSIPDVNSKIKDIYVNPTAKSLTVSSLYARRLYVASVEGTYSERYDDCYVHIQACYGTSTKIKTLSVKSCVALEDLYVESKNISDFTFSDSIKRFYLAYNQSKKINLSSMKNLEWLKISAVEYLTSIDMSKNHNLKYVSVDASTKLKNVDFRKVNSLQYLYIGNEVLIRKLNLSKNTKIKLAVINTWNHGMDVTMPSGMGGKLVKYSVKGIKKYFESARKIWDIISKNGIDHSDNKEISTDYQWNREKDDNSGEVDYYQKKIVKWNKEEFPEIYGSFSYDIDWNHDGWLSQVELDGASTLTIDKKISSLKGLEYFRHINTLTLKKYAGTTLEISSKNVRLRVLRVHPMKKSFKLVAPSIKGVVVDVDGATSNVDLGACKSAQGVKVSDTRWNEYSITKLVLPKSDSLLEYIGLNQLKIKSLDIKSYPNLKIFGHSYCPDLKPVNFSQNTNLLAIWFVKMNKKKETCDLSKCSKLLELMIGGYDEAVKIIRPKGRHLPNRETNFWIYELMWANEIYASM